MNLSPISMMHKKQRTIGPSQEMMTDFSETSIWDWDVFLSFRGPNTRHKFTDHLYHNLKEKNIRVFRDVEGIRAGDEISPSLDKAIERSRLSVVIFSKDYASSDSCLDELVTILKCKKERKQRVIPIFYEVKVSELQCHKMDEHEEKYGKDRVKIWTSALKEVSTLKGESYHAGYEHEFLEKIVNHIMSFLGPNKVLLGELVKISNKVLDDAENKEITDPDVKSWLDELKDEVYDAEDLLAYDSYAIASDSSSVVAKVGTKVEEKLKEILERLAQRKKEMEKLGLGVLEHFKWLNTLSIYACSKMVCFPKCELASTTLSRLDLVGLEKLKSLPEQMKSGLPCLVYLGIWNCPELESFPEGGLPSKLESLKINSCKKLMERRKEWNLQALPSLSSLKYERYSFDETESFPGEGMLLPPTLTTLHIEFVDGLKSLDHKGLQHLTSLKTLEIWFCDSLEKLVTDEEGGEEGLLPQSLTTLELWDIPKLKSLSPIHRLTSLISLSIHGCDKISEEVALPATITFLELVEMEMKSVDGWGLQRLASLEELRIFNCPNIESITTREEPLPSSLRVIELQYCPRLRSIQRGEAIPSSLRSLHIFECPLLEEKYQTDLNRYV